jgi:hypothetical protein
VLYITKKSSIFAIQLHAFYKLGATMESGNKEMFEAKIFSTPTAPEERGDFATGALTIFVHIEFRAKDDEFSKWPGCSLV